MFVEHRILGHLNDIIHEFEKIKKNDICSPAQVKRLDFYLEFLRKAQKETCEQYLSDADKIAKMGKEDYAKFFD